MTAGVMEMHDEDGSAPIVRATIGPRAGYAPPVLIHLRCPLNVFTWSLLFLAAIAGTGCMQGPQSGGVSGLWPIMQQNRGVSVRIAQAQARHSRNARGPSATNSGHGAISGPLASGKTVRSGDLVVQQIGVGHTLISLQGSTLEISSDRHRGERYTFYVEPQRASDQRVVRIASTYGVAVTEKPNTHASVQLVCHQSRSSDPDTLSVAPRAHIGQDIAMRYDAPRSQGQPALPTDNEFTTGVTYAGRKLVGVTLEIDGKGIEIDASLPAGARFAYDLAPDWSGPNGTERAVRIIATPGVRVIPYSRPPGDPPVTYGRKPVAEVIYVQNPRLVPAHGQKIHPSGFLTMQAHIGTNPRDRRSSLMVTTGRSGVTVREVVTGSVLRLHDDTQAGALFAYQILTPAQQGVGGVTTKIRVLAGPGAKVEVYEPRIRPMLGADEIDSFGDMNVELELYRTADATRIPAQGAALTTHFLSSVGKRSSPDARHWGTPTTGQTVALAVADSSLSAIPGVGDAADFAELGRAVLTGKDRHNRPVSTVDVCIMGIAAILPIIGPSALRTVSRGARGATAIAARFGRTMDEMDALLVRASMLTPQDRAAIGRINRALRTGTRVDTTDLRHVRESLDQLGFVIDLAPSHGDIFLFPEMATALGRTGASGEVAETAAIRIVGRQAAGVVRRPRHHLLPREHRQWFEERGFVGDKDIDNYTVELDQSSHQALHGGGNWRLGRTWPREWNQAVMRVLTRREQRLGRKLRPDEILDRIEKLMKTYHIRGPFVPYSGQ